MDYHDIHGHDVFSFDLPSTHRLPTVSAAEALLDFEENEGTFIPTGIPDLDAVLGSVLDHDGGGEGGIQRGQVTEIWGPPGSGKTAFGIQLAAHCLRDGGEVVWVDFTHHVSFERMRRVVGAAIETQDEEATLAFLDMVTYYMFDSLPHFVAQICRPAWHVPPATALIVIDSLSALLTYAFPREDDAEDSGAPGGPGKQPGPAPPGDAKDKKKDPAVARRHETLQYIIGSLQKLAAARDLAVVILTESSTRSDLEHDTALIPAVMGSAWEQGVSTRLLLFRDWTSDGLESRALHFAAVKKLNGKTDSESADHVSAFDMTQDGVRPVGPDFTSPTLPVLPSLAPAPVPAVDPAPDPAPTPAAAHPRLVSPGLEVPDSQDDEDDWGDD